MWHSISKIGILLVIRQTNCLDSVSIGPIFFTKSCHLILQNTFLTKIDKFRSILSNIMFFESISLKFLRLKWCGAFVLIPQLHFFFNNLLFEPCQMCTFKNLSRHWNRTLKWWPFEITDYTQLLYNTLLSSNSAAPWKSALLRQCAFSATKRWFFWL